MAEKIKAGIEVHQQLDTKKLFCACPSEIIDEKPDFIVKRKLKMSLSETGKVDSAAHHEILKEKEFHYQGYNKYTCLVELDDEPPHELNKDALQIALQVSKMLNCRIVDHVVVMRKIVLDGSNTGGFQRTALIATDGWINIDGKKISIQLICLEEDACKIVERTPDYDVYNLSRLGIPLLEISTGPDIETGEMCKKTAEYIGMVLRSTGKVKRGIGTIRQDVNVSIPGGNRVEIKGAQELRIIDKMAEIEAGRQKKLLEIKSEIEKRKIKLLKTPEIKDASNVLKKSECAIIKKCFENKGKVLGIKVNGFSGLIGIQLQPNKRLGTEFSDYGKVTAGITGLFHSDELPKYGITAEEVKRLREFLGCSSNDAFIIIADKQEKAQRAINAVWQRVLMCFNGVPCEVRKAEIDGTTSFMRPLSGSARMYPETDIMPIKTETGKLKSAKLLTDIAKELEEKYCFSHDLAVLASKSPKIEIILKIITTNKNIKPAFIAEIILSADKEIKNQYNKEITLKDNVFIDVFSKVNEGKLQKDRIISVLFKSNSMSIEEILKKESLGEMDQKTAEREIKKIIDKNKGKSLGALMGIAMEKLKGKISGKSASEILKRFLN